MNQSILEKQIVEDKIKGLTYQEIGNKYGVNLRFIEKAITKETGINVSVPKKLNKANNLFPREFKLEQKTVWSFKSRGNWATHNGNYRGNWSPYIPRNIISRYSKENDLVLDYFCGAGTTAVECKLLDRNFIGVDINQNAIELAKQNLNFAYLFTPNIDLKVGDARNLKFISDDSVDLICAHPPYANIINYTHNNKNDLSNSDVENFLIQIEQVAKESYRILKKNKYCSILIGDMRKNKNVIPLGFRTIEKYLKAGFKLKELIIKRQHNCKTTGFWYNNSIKFNFLLLAHEYLAIFEKSNKKVKSPDFTVLTKQKFNINKNIYLESTTVWLFESNSFIDKTISNLAKRYTNNFCIYNENYNPHKNLIIYFFDNNYIKFLNDIKKLKENDLIAIICEDNCMNNGLIWSQPIFMDNELLKNDNFKIKEIIILTKDASDNIKNKTNCLNITHKYILIYKKV